ncbi:hypothetical protein C1H46_001641 [Malus baccata]|uniref:Uncharacterized protein n=1 Tax=Malus baccata TaxID=106549 RepID=A0A540NNZ9_MALBA|nr:hypothetical protein C1H46_001641 [Malus baccata]
MRSSPATPKTRLASIVGPLPTTTSPSRSRPRAISTATIMPPPSLSWQQKREEQTKDIVDNVEAPPTPLVQSLCIPPSSLAPSLGRRDGSVAELSATKKILRYKWLIWAKKKMTAWVDPNWEIGF